MDIRNTATAPHKQFSKVPNALVQDPRLSPDAKLILLFIASCPPHSVVRMKTIRHQLGVSDWRWRQATQQLRAVGAMSNRTLPPLRVGEARRHEIHVTYDPWIWQDEN